MAVMMIARGAMHDMSFRFVSAKSIMKRLIHIMNIKISRIKTIHPKEPPNTSYNE